MDTTRRSFLGVSAAFLCTLGPNDAIDFDRKAARVKAPKATAAQDVPQLQPAPGGVRREYWVQAETVRWAITPARRDEWHNRPLSSRNVFRAYGYRLMTPGFADYASAAPAIPGPTLTGEVGDVLVVHFRNADRTLGQAVTMHPHGVRYNPEYDGSYMGEYTRAGGFIAPGETFTYQWECTPQSVGAWPYHDHGPNHTLN